MGKLLICTQRIAIRFRVAPPILRHRWLDCIGGFLQSYLKGVRFPHDAPIFNGGYVLRLSACFTRKFHRVRLPDPLPIFRSISVMVASQACHA